MQFPGEWRVVILTQHEAVEEVLQERPHHAEPGATEHNDVAGELGRGLGCKPREHEAEQYHRQHCADVAVEVGFGLGVGDRIGVDHNAILLHECMGAAVRSAFSAVEGEI